jgi:hypothetical protein
MACYFAKSQPGEFWVSMSNLISLALRRQRSGVRIPSGAPIISNAYVVVAGLPNWPSKHIASKSPSFHWRRHTPHTANCAVAGHAAVKWWKGAARSTVPRRFNVRNVRHAARAMPSGRDCVELRGTPAFPAPPPKLRGHMASWQFHAQRLKCKSARTAIRADKTFRSLHDLIRQLIGAIVQCLQIANPRCCALGTNQHF